jgi:hypothetical protein
MLALSLKYWWKLNQDCLLGNSSLAVQALLDNRSLDCTNLFTWSKGIKNICHLIGKDELWNKPNILSKSSIIHLVNTNLKLVYDQDWYAHVSIKQKKLRTYCLFKSSFGQENYVHLLNRTQRSAFCKIRISAHILMIEKGRYSYPKIPPENRLCTICDLHETEDEFHFIIKCKAYTDLREELLCYINDVYDTDNYSDRDYFIHIMGAKDYDTLKVISNYIISALETRLNVM